MTLVVLWTWLAVELAAAVVVWLDSRWRPRRPATVERPQESPPAAEHRPARIRCVCLEVGEERYVFALVDTPENRRAIVEVAWRYAASQALNFPPAGAFVLGKALAALPAECVVKSQLRR